MSVKLLGININQETKEIVVTMDVGGVYVDELLDNSKELVSRMYNDALYQYEGNLRYQIEAMSKE